MPCAKEAAAEGLLEPGSIEAFLRERLAAARIAKMQAAREKLAAVAPPSMTAEEIEAEMRAYRAERGVAAADLFEGYAALVQLVIPAVIGAVILADPDDDIVLATAVSCGADAIVSGDTHLLGISEFQGIPIVTPAAAVSRLAV